MITGRCSQLRFLYLHAFRARARTQARSRVRIVEERAFNHFFSNLKVLNLENCRIDFLIPPLNACRNLKKLEKLYLSNNSTLNCIESFPENIKPPNLKLLDLRGSTARISPKILKMMETGKYIPGVTILTKFEVPSP